MLQTRSYLKALVLGPSAASSAALGHRQVRRSDPTAPLRVDTASAISVSFGEVDLRSVVLLTCELAASTDRRMQLGGRHHVLVFQSGSVSFAERGHSGTPSEGRRGVLVADGRVRRCLIPREHICALRLRLCHELIEASLFNGLDRRALHALMVRRQERVLTVGPGAVASQSCPAHCLHLLLWAMIARRG